MDISINRAEYIELYVSLGNSKQRLYFPDLPNLRSNCISGVVGIEAYSNEEQSVSNSGKEVVDLADFKKVTITFYFEGGEYIVCPLIAFRRIDGDSYNFFSKIPKLDNQIIDWTKSYVNINEDVSNFEDKSFVLNCYYNPL